MMTTMILESPEGDRVAISGWAWGTAEITPYQVERQTGLQDLWNVYATDSMNGDFDPAALDTEGWHTVAEVDDTSGPHIRLYPERMLTAAMTYLGFSETY